MNAQRSRRVLPAVPAALVTVALACTGCDPLPAREPAQGAVIYRDGAPVAYPVSPSADGRAAGAAGASAVASPGSADAGPTPAVGDAAPARFDADGDRDAGAQPEPALSGVLTVRFISRAAGGRYAPRNVGAVWIETGDGRFVKTIERWATIRASHLRSWKAASGGWGWSPDGASESDLDRVDVVTAATLSEHVAHSSSWIGRDANGDVAPDGAYQLVVEIADDDVVLGRVAFQKGAAALALDPPDTQAFESMHLTYEP